MADARFDGNIELSFLDKKIKDLQKGLLQAEEQDLPNAQLMVRRISEAIEADKKKLDEYRVRRIRLAAEMEEAKGVERVHNPPPDTIKNRM